MDCKICGKTSERTFRALLLRKYDVEYLKCSKCGFIQTEDPYWLSEAYASAITSLDLGLLHRNTFLQPVTSALIDRNFNRKAKFLDFGGGYGTFTRLMRDIGYDFYRQDTYCDNLFAKEFDISNLPEGTRFELLTAFEVFEHLVNPIPEIEKMLSLSESVFFSTELIPADVSGEKQWWYFMPETGQHVSFYTRQSLQMLADKYNLNFYTNNVNYHLFTKKKMSPFVFRLLTRYKVAKLYNMALVQKRSLLMKDYEHILTSQATPDQQTDANMKS